MNHADIETFLMLVKTKNITKTAENLYISQPTVSHRLKLLEDELHVCLLIRKKGYKKVELTAKGEEFVPIAERWLSLMNETMMLQHAEEEQHLTIGCPNTLNSCIFAGLYRQILGEKDLNMHLNISTHYSFELYELLENHAIDVGFVYHHLHFKHILSEPILREQMYIVQNQEGAVRRERLSIDELDPQQEVCLIWETNYQIWHEQMISKGKKNGIEVDGFGLLSELLLDPGRWSIAPKTVVDKLRQIQPVYVSQIADRHQPPERITYMIKNRDMTEAKTRAIDLFVARMEAYFGVNGLRGSQTDA